MRKTTAREKVFMGIGVVAALGIFVYFILWPLLQDDKSKSKNSSDQLQTKMQLLEKFEGIIPMVDNLENRMRIQTGYGEASFKRGIADTTIIKYISQAAAQAGIGNLEQLDPKPDTSKKTATTDVKSDSAILLSIVDQIYLDQVMKEKEIKAISPDETTKTENPDPDATKEANTTDIKAPSGKANEVDESAKEDTQKEKTDESAKNTAIKASAKAESKKITFPPMPKDIPDEVKQALTKAIETRSGKTVTAADINRIMDDSKVDNEKERERISNRLTMYSNRVKEVKSEIEQLIKKLDIPQDVKKSDKASKFTVKMVFKSQMDQLVKFLYNLQNSAKWVKVESMQISISDRKQTLLGVELSMTATVLYD